MRHRRAALLALAAALVLPVAGFGQQYGDEAYRPSVGQPGKDVVWVPTPDSMVTRMLQAAKVTDRDFVVDLGAGDGKIAIAAAKQFGARALGIEYNHDMAALAQRNAERSGVADRVRIIEGDVFKEDFTSATVVTMYLLPDLNLKLRPTILAMKPGTRVVSHQFHMGEWQPDEVLDVEGRSGYLWIVPAKVAGDWTLKEEGGPGAEAKLSVTQSFQRIGGTATVAGKTQPLLGASLRGRDVTFTFRDGAGNVRTFNGAVDGNAMEGRLLMPSGGWQNAAARRG